MKKLNTDDFFEGLNEEELNVFEKLYKTYLTKTTNDWDISTGKNYTEKEIQRLHQMCNSNLEKISESRKK